MVSDAACFPVRIIHYDRRKKRGYFEYSPLQDIHLLGKQPKSHGHKADIVCQETDYGKKIYVQI